MSTAEEDSSAKPKEDQMNPRFDFHSLLFYVISAAVAGFMGYMFFPGNVLFIGAGVVMGVLMNYFNFFKGGSQGVSDAEGFFAIFVLVSLLVSGYFLGQTALWIFGAAVMGNIVAAVLRLVTSGR